MKTRERGGEGEMNEGGVFWTRSVAEERGK